MRIYFDENFSKYLAAGFNAFQKGSFSEEIEVFHLTDNFPEGSPDEEWIHGVAKQEACVITEDLNIYRTKSQWEIYKNYSVGFFFFKQPKKKMYSYWQWIQEI